jgi:hypothetical protein
MSGPSASQKKPGQDKEPFLPSDLSLMNGALFDVYRNSFVLTHPDALEQKKMMHLSLRANTLVKYRDANRRII